MQNEVTTNNNIFKYAFTGVLLFIASFAYAVANRSSIDGINSTTIVAAMLGVASVWLLAKAVKAERNQGKLSTI